MVMFSWYVLIPEAGSAGVTVSEYAPGRRLVRQNVPRASVLVVRVAVVVRLLRGISVTVALGLGVGSTPKGGLQSVAVPHAA